VLVPRSGSRRATELAVALVATMLVAGVAFGFSLGRTAPNQPAAEDDLSWVPDRGDALQVNPGTGHIENRLPVADPGTGFTLAQRDGLLIVLDGDGILAVIDEATLGVGGHYAAGDTAKVLLDPTHLFVVDLSAGTITRLDPTTAAVLDAWSAGLPLADAAVDGTGTLYALGIDGRLHRLVWTDAGATTSAAPVTVDGAGPGSVLVAHNSGVTILNPGNSTAVRVGSVEDATLTVPGLAGTILAPERAPLDLVPVTVDGTPRVILVAGTTVMSVDVSAFGCAKPGQPAVHAGHIYLPCAGTGHIVVLDGAGNHAGGDLSLGDSGTAVITLDGGRLYAILPGAEAGVVVNPDLSTVAMTFGTTAAISSTVGSTAPVPGATAGPTTGTGKGGGSGTGGGTTSTGGGTTKTTPPGPGARDTVPMTLGTAQGSDTSQCGVSAPFPQCVIIYGYYILTVTPPGNWHGFTGTCELHDTGGISGGDTPVPCDASSQHVVGTGDGRTHTFTVTACQGSDCVTSKPVQYRLDVLPSGPSP
jgi:hypothetical protein